LFIFYCVYDDTDIVGYWTGKYWCNWSAILLYPFTGVDDNIVFWFFIYPLLCCCCCCEYKLLCCVDVLFANILLLLLFSNCDNPFCWFYLNDFNTFMSYNFYLVKSFLSSLKNFDFIGSNWDDGFLIDCWDCWWGWWGYL
jgi:hypothetical protein